MMCEGPLSEQERSHREYGWKAEFAGLAGCERGYLDFRTIQAFSKDLGLPSS